MESIIHQHVRDHQAAVTAIADLAPAIQQAAQACITSINAGGKILLCGNGGSAGDAQHIAAELVGRFIDDRRSLPGIALTTDTSALTAIANDYGYERVFSRQVEGLARPGDVLIGLSTSGQSANVNLAIETAEQQGCTTIGLSGKQGGALADLAGLCITVPNMNTARIQECHILIGHILCDLIERGVAA